MVFFVKSILVSSVLLYGSLALFAADEDSKSVKISPTFKTNVYLEFGGNAAAIAPTVELGFDHPFGSETINGVYLSGGWGFAWVFPGFAPIMAKVLLFGNDCLEIGAGASFVHTPQQEEWQGVAWSDAKVNPTAVVGYRYQPKDTGVLFRIGFAPILDLGNGRIFPLFGASIGYSF